MSRFAISLSLAFLVVFIIGGRWTSDPSGGTGICDMAGTKCVSNYADFDAMFATMETGDHFIVDIDSTTLGTDVSADIGIINDIWVEILPGVTLTWDCDGVGNHRNMFEIREGIDNWRFTGGGTQFWKGGTLDLDTDACTPLAGGGSAIWTRTMEGLSITGLTILDCYQQCIEFTQSDSMDVSDNRFLFSAGGLRNDGTYFTSAAIVGKRTDGATVGIDAHKATHNVAIRNNYIRIPAGRCISVISDGSTSLNDTHHNWFITGNLCTMFPKHEDEIIQVTTNSIDLGADTVGFASAHGLIERAGLKKTYVLDDGGAIPTGLNLGKEYWLEVVDSDTVAFHDTEASRDLGASGSRVNLTVDNGNFDVWYDDWLRRIQIGGGNGIMGMELFTCNGDKELCYGNALVVAGNIFEDIAGFGVSNLSGSYAAFTGNIFQGYGGVGIEQFGRHVAVVGNVFEADPEKRGVPTGISANTGGDTNAQGQLLVGNVFDQHLHGIGNAYGDRMLTVGNYFRSNDFTVQNDGPSDQSGIGLNIRTPATSTAYGHLFSSNYIVSGQSSAAGDCTRVDGNTVLMDGNICENADEMFHLSKATDTEMTNITIGESLLIGTTKFLDVRTAGTWRDVYAQLPAGYEAESNNVVEFNVGPKVGYGPVPAPKCDLGDWFIDTDQDVDTTLATVNDNALIYCTAVDTWTRFLDPTLPTTTPPACAVANEGDIYYDTTLEEPCFCDSAVTDWKSVVDGADCTP